MRRTGSQPRMNENQVLRTRRESRDKIVLFRKIVASHEKLISKLSRELEIQKKEMDILKLRIRGLEAFH